MINCKKCGAELPDYAKFCNLCGSAVGEVKSGAEINTVENNKEELSLWRKKGDGRARLQLLE